MTGVWNQEDGVRAKDEESAVGRWQGRQGRGDEKGHQREIWVGEWDLQCRRQRESRERKRLGFLTGIAKGEEKRNPGELEQDTDAAYQREQRVPVSYRYEHGVMDNVAVYRTLP